MNGKVHRKRWPDFGPRWHGLELMDDPACDEKSLRRTLDQFASLNRWVSGYRRILSKWVLDDMARTDANREWHLADLGAGGCDIAVWVLRAARRRGIKLAVTAVDRDPRVLDHARLRHGREPGLHLRKGDLNDLPAVGPFDYLFANHVLHHLPDRAIPQVLAGVQAAAGRRWVVSDLLRSRWAYAGFWILGFAYQGGFAAEDGLRSIRKGFTPDELRTHLRAAGLADQVILRRYFPARVCLIGFGNSAQETAPSKRER